MGLPTGANDSVSLANIYVHWVLSKFWFWDKQNKNLSRYIGCFWRFIDDMFGNWKGSKRQFFLFVASLNKFGVTYGINIKPEKCQCDHTVNFLDVKVSNVGGSITTSVYNKPTDANCYLHRSSYHPAHTFQNLPFAQMRRAVVISSNSELCEQAIDMMVAKFH